MKRTSKPDPKNLSRRDADSARSLPRVGNGRARLHRVPQTAPSSPRAADVAAPDVAATDDVANELRIRALRRKRARQKLRARALMVLIPSIVISLFLMAATHVVMGDWRHWQGEVSAREAQMAALDTQLAIGRHRLTTLQAPKGREQLLVEHGFLRPGDRILLFPPTPEEKRAIAQNNSNDLSPHAEVSASEPTGSAVSRAARSIADWWRSHFK